MANNSYILIYSIICKKRYLESKVNLKNLASPILLTDGTLVPMIAPPHLGHLLLGGGRHQMPTTQHLNSIIRR